MHLGFNRLDALLFLNALLGSISASGALVLETHALLVRLGHALLEDGLRLDRLELGLEVLEGLGLC
jgi:hypothetical protein